MTYGSPVSSNDQFGDSVSIWGTTIVVGAPADSAGDIQSGAIHVYDTASGVLRRAIRNPDARRNAQFGDAVQVHGEMVAVGASGYEASTVYVFNVATGELLYSENDFRDRVGRSVALSDRYLVVGSHGDDTGAAFGASVYVFDAASGQPLHELTGLTR